MRFADIIADALEAGRDRLNRADTLRSLNDAFRRAFVDGHVVATRGLMVLDPDDWRAVFQAVREFDGFTPEDDPHGEHDFGVVSYRGERYFWKIDYHGLDLRHASPDPADPAFTVRVMTIMRADEYFTMTTAAPTRPPSKPAPPAGFFNSGA